MTDIEKQVEAIDAELAATLEARRPFVATRKQYNDRMAALLRRIISDPDQLAAEVNEGYPKPTDEVVAELAWRGLDAHPGRLDRLANILQLRRAQDGQALWHQRAIDEHAEWLLQTNRLTTGCRHRMLYGMTFADFLASVEGREAIADAE